MRPYDQKVMGDLLSETSKQLFYSLDHGLKERGLPYIQKCLLTGPYLSKACNANELMGAYYKAIWSLKNLEVYEFLKKPELNHLTNNALTALDILGIEPQDPQWGYLYSDLYFSIASTKCSEKLYKEALWKINMGRHASQKAVVASEPNSLLEVGINYLNMGRIHRSIDIFQTLIDKCSDKGVLLQAILRKVEALQMLGYVYKAEAIIHSALDYDLDEKDLKEFRWLDLINRTQQRGDLEEIKRHLHRSGEFFDSQKCLEIMLWSYCMENRFEIERLPKIPSLRYHFPTEFKSDPHCSLMLRAINILKYLHHGQHSDIEKLEKAGELFLKCDSYPIRLKLITLGALANWLKVSNNDLFLKDVLNEIKIVGLNISDCENSDPLGILTKNTTVEAVDTGA